MIVHVYTCTCALYSLLLLSFFLYPKSVPIYVIVDVHVSPANLHDIMHVALFYEFYYQSCFKGTQCSSQSILCKSRNSFHKFFRR